MRACGERKKGGLYLVVPTSAHGRPLEDFLIDPPIEYAGKPFRAPQLVLNPGTGAYDVLMWVGKRYYPYVPDYLSEVAQYGVSKRVPRNFAFEKLTPDKSRLFIVHPRAIPRFEYEIHPYYKPICPRGLEEHKAGLVDSSEMCIKDLWNLSTQGESSDKHSIRRVVDKDLEVHYEITTPSVQYTAFGATCPPVERQEYAAGIVAGFYISHFEYVGNAPEDMRRRAQESGWRLVECGE